LFYIDQQLALVDVVSSNKPEDDDLFGELDDMLADLNAQLNVIIPTSST